MTDHRPAPEELPPYHQAYARLVPEADVLTALAAAIEETARLLEGPLAHHGDHAYAPGKWTVKEIVHHLADAERVFAYRALRIARGDATPLAGFEQDDYVREGGAHHRPLTELLAEYRTVRAATLSLGRSFTHAQWLRRGTVNGQIYSVRGLIAICLGHERHHRAVLAAQYVRPVS